MKNQIENSLKIASDKIAPAWPLKTVVAVNPYLGLSDQHFSKASTYLEKLGNVKTTMPINFYLQLIEQKEIGLHHIDKALSQHSMGWKNPSDFIIEAKRLATTSYKPNKYPILVLELAEERTKISWKEFMVNQLSLWAGSYFDEDQSTWKSADGTKGLFSTWKTEAEKDRSPEIMGLKGFRTLLKTLPNDYKAAAQFILGQLEVSEEITSTYLHGLLLQTLGWSSFIRGIDWDKNVYGQESELLQEWQAIFLCWEYVVHQTFKHDGLQSTWENAKETLSHLTTDQEDDKTLEFRLVFQEAYELSAQEQLQIKFKKAPKHQGSVRPRFEAVFCIDVRSEVYRRNLESCSAEIGTTGFAGFFGFPISYKPIASEKAQNQCPVLLPTSLDVHEELESIDEHHAATKTRTGNLQLKKTWKKFKTSAVASFGFVSPLGINYLPKLITDSFGWTAPAENPHKAGLGKYTSASNRINTQQIDLQQKIETAANALVGMGMAEQQAPLVLLAGHGSTTVNNPHGSGLDCGACGGQAGDANARVAASVLNELEVRKGLKEKGIEISSETYFIAGLHNTTTDEVTLFDEDLVPASHTKQVNELKALLKKAGKFTRMERAPRMKINPDQAENKILERSKDWSTVRPEWGLSGCNAFVIAPRYRTAKVNLEGRSFLHNYAWSADEGFKLLEAIMTAPMVVTSWINLQYYGSTVDPLKLGAGDKTLHNVTAGKGVLEGASGDLRIGLPWQSIHDGEEYQHLPQRLNVVIEAPIQAINKILQQHHSLKQLFDNRWISLLHLNEAGEIDQRYNSNFQWEKLTNDNVNAKKQKVVTSKPVYHENI